MVIVKNDWPRYKTTCDNCEKKISFTSNKPASDIVEVICECYHIWALRIPDDPGKYRYKTQAKIEIIRHEILATFADIRMRMTVRQVYYQLVTRNEVDKTEAGYNRVQSQLLLMRQEGLIPYTLVSDSSRRFYQVEAFNGLEDAVTSWLHYYRLDVWKNIDAHVEIWLEKEALSGIFTEVTDEFNVPLYVTKGFTSDSFAFTAANQIKRINKPTYIYIFSDHDPSGVLLSDTIIKKLKAFGVDPHCERVGLTKEQIEDLNLPSRPTKKSTHLKGFIGESTELDAMDPRLLQELIRQCIYQHISPHDINNIKMEEATHKETLSNILGHT